MDTQIGFNTALTMAKGEPGTDTFFDIPYGTGADGVARWPSLQYARHGSETGMIRGALYPQANAYAEETNQGFTLWVPDKAPYWPSASYNPDGLPNIVEISDEEFLPGGEPNPKYDPDFKAKVFTAWFESGEKW